MFKQLAQGCTWHRGGRDSTPRPVDRKSGSLTTRPPSHTNADYTGGQFVYRQNGDAGFDDQGAVLHTGADARGHHRGAEFGVDVVPRAATDLRRHSRPESLSMFFIHHPLPLI